MKLVNKLSVISLIVLMFSFMNVANAAGNWDNMEGTTQCAGKKVINCDNASKTKADCESTWRGVVGSSFQQFRWDSSTSQCRADGAYCASNKY